jgi:hypothetical protein
VASLRALGIACVCLLLGAGTAWGVSERAPEPASAARESLPASPVPAAGATTPAAQGELSYVDTSLLQDFEVHFLVSLPFTGLYSYVAVTLLDGAVEGAFPTTLHQADLWVIIGLALGGSLAVALGSAGRVPDQSVPRVGSKPADSGPQIQAGQATAKVPLVRMRF